MGTMYGGVRQGAQIAVSGSRHGKNRWDDDAVKSPNFSSVLKMLNCNVMQVDTPLTVE